MISANAKNGANSAGSGGARYLDAVRRHLETLHTRGRALLPSGARTAMWMAAIDLETGDYPVQEPKAGKRVYRNIDAPFGASLYWDQPLITAARLLSRATGNETPARAAADYVREFLAKCVAGNGLFLWGNHYFFKPSLDAVVKFHVDEPPFPVSPGADRGELHEARPLTPNWDAFHEIAPEQTAAAVRAMGVHHLYDADTGGFNRHADRKCDHAFLEAGGVLVESLAWLAVRESDADALELARRVARYSFNHRGPATGLVENNPSTTRWDKHTATTEIALWAACLLRAARRSGEDEFAELAGRAVTPYLEHGFDAAAGTFFGMLRVKDGSPVLNAAETIYQPADHVDFWHPLFPRHDYPFHLGLVCLELLQRTGQPHYRQGAERVVTALTQALRDKGARPIYAEHYGRAIRLYQRAAVVLARPELQREAEAVADEALERLFAGSLFRGHTGEERYEAVDGVGYLALALLHLAGAVSENEPESAVFF